MTRVLDGKVAVITGGASGLGLAMVEAFVAEGCRVVVADVDRENVEAVSGRFGSDVAFRSADVADPGDMRALTDYAVDQFGGLDVMVNNAAIPGPRFPTLLDTNFDQFDRVMRVNLLGVMAGTQQAARHMAGSGGGSIVNISSIAGVQPTAGPFMYSASKAAIAHFTRCAALDLGEHGIRVNCIAPAHVPTPILGRFLDSLPPAEKEGRLKEIRAGMLARQPLKRAGTGRDVAEAVVYFASERSCYVTGTVLSVDGGAAVGAPPVRPRQ